MHVPFGRWALGILIFEMIASTPPFTDTDGADLQTFANILKGELIFPPEDGEVCPPCPNVG